MIYAGGSAGGIAALIAKKRREKEEEAMTRYSTDELEDDWEFKIVRASFGSFRNAQSLQQLLDEESHAGWVMLEKFDDSRIRFKRPRSARARDHTLPPGVDPYRTSYGAGDQALLWIFIAVIAFTVLLVILSAVFS